ncbi:MAG TPA: DUF4097 family beta strand repeat-containing protein [Candidatus Dormibacteraeota bacterium]|nr:DUF4097 family beta strand repeat-containing protein [Candidatus Dormibacteraeota bacterium]
MPTFDTPQPISVTIDLGVGDVRIVASDRSDTVVEVKPRDPGKRSDALAAEQTRVEYAAGRLLIKAPRGWRQFRPWGGAEAIDVEIALPSRSQLRSEVGLGTVRCTGQLGECRCQTGLGDIQLDEAGPVHLKTGSGDVTVERVLDHADVTIGSGTVHVGSIAGGAVVKNSNGDTWIGEVAGDLRVNAANGRISVDAAHSTVAAKTARGDVRLGEVMQGAVLAETALGKLDIGVRDGVVAWLDLNTHFGTVHSDLQGTDAPRPGEGTVEVRARTSFGDISVRRAAPRSSGAPQSGRAA